MRLVLAADDGVHPEPAEPPRIDRRIQTVCAQHRPRRQGADLREHFERDPGRGVHRQVDADHVGGGERIGGQALDGQIAAMHPKPGVVEPARRLRETERLAPQLVGADEDDSGHVAMERVNGPAAATG